MSTPADRWVVIDRWDDFQHPDALRSGVPPWIKTYTGLLANDDFLDLSHHLRGVLLGLWLEYARARRQLRGSTSALSRRLGQRVTTRDLEALNQAGWLHFSASKPASKVASTPARPEKRREERTTRTRESKSKTECPLCTVECRRDWKLEEHLFNVHSLQGDDLERALAAAREGRT